MRAQHRYLAIVVSLLTLTLSTACEKKAPRYQLKVESGSEAVQHFDLMRDQPKYVNYRRDKFDKRKAIEERRIAKDKERGIYRKESLWDF